MPIDESGHRIDASRVLQRAFWRVGVGVGVPIFHFPRHFPRWAARIPAARPHTAPVVPGAAQTAISHGSHR